LAEASQVHRLAWVERVPTPARATSRRARICSLRRASSQLALPRKAATPYRGKFSRPLAGHISEANRQVALSRVHISEANGQAASAHRTGSPYRGKFSRPLAGHIFEVNRQLALARVHTSEANGQVALASQSKVTLTVCDPSVTLTEIVLVFFLSVGWTSLICCEPIGRRSGWTPLSFLVGPRLLPL
jgi:hypothetical protein